MKFTVVWSRDAESDLGQSWIDADSRVRADITVAANFCDEMLATNAHRIGESRSGKRRVVVIPPLVIHFEVIVDDRFARVLSIHVISSNDSSENGRSL